MANSKISARDFIAADGAYEVGISIGGGLSRKTTFDSILSLIGSPGISKTKIVQGTITDQALGLEHTVTWNDVADTFTAQKLNVTDTNSATASLLLDLQVGSASKFRVRKDGALILGGNADIVFQNNSANLTLLLQDGQRFSLHNQAGVEWAELGNGFLALGAFPDLYIFRDAADILAQRRDTNAQTFRVYGTWTDASNYERAALSATATTKVTLAAQTAGTGTDNLDVELLPAGTGVVQVSNPQDGAAAQTATMTNGPTAGNPAIWLKVKIGTDTRYIPAWA